jgi:hypothetical protein
MDRREMKGGSTSLVSLRRHYPDQVRNLGGSFEGISHPRKRPQDPYVARLSYAIAVAL